jgi:hypothetical protein
MANVQPPSGNTATPDPYPYIRPCEKCGKEITANMLFKTHLCEDCLVLGFGEWVEATFS